MFRKLDIIFPIEFEVISATRPKLRKDSVEFRIPIFKNLVATFLPNKPSHSGNHGFHLGIT